MRRFDSLAVILIAVAGSAHAQGRTLDLGEARINYEVTGRGRPVVFIDGWALHDGLG
jgi:hypothetical protein